ncbi:hypothetical protein NHX12_005223 [Muraenolepis orangiensis]|uniref:Uncharacterized protein n=1 Tax=Muraenolepis orangiensis TaxID=630683 RepID=A0A9Q0IC43_9TELE|nr:hypothetical protein NHX12_005223 [Muraenolepis orangiensis]
MSAPVPLLLGSFCRQAFERDHVLTWPDGCLTGGEYNNIPSSDRFIRTTANDKPRQATAALRGGGLAIGRVTEGTGQRRESARHLSPLQEPPPAACHLVGRRGGPSVGPVAAVDRENPGG